MIYLKSVYAILLISYILTSMLIPLVSFNKLVFAALVLIYAVYILFLKKKEKFACLEYTIAPIIILAIFAFGYTRGVDNQADLKLARQFLLVTSMFALVYPIQEFEIDFQRILQLVAKVYIIFFAIYVIYAINIKEFDIPVFIERFAGFLDHGITRTIGRTLETYCSGLMKYRTFFGGKGMQIYLGTTPFLMVLADILFIDYLRNKKLSDLFWVGLSLVLTLTTGSRTMMILIPASLCILLWLNLDRMKQIAALILVGIAGTAIFVYLFRNSTFFSMSEKSNFVKAGHISSYLKQLNLKQFLIGDGLATYYFSENEGRILAHTEITLLDHFRYFGVILSGIIWFLMIVPKPNKDWKNWKCWRVWQMKEETVVLLLYMFFAQTNPVLFNSFGLICVLWYWNIWLSKKKKEEIV